jgi:hypothetical protein
MTLSFAGPYLPLDQDHVWLRGNHHGHSTRSDGTCPPEDEIRAYSDAGYSYMALSEHDLFIPPEAYAGIARIILLPAVEVTSSAGQTLMMLGGCAAAPPAGAADLAGIAAAARAAGSLFIVDHPNWRHRPDRLHATFEDIAAAGCDHIEIYTGVIGRLEGSADATGVWDRLLTAGHRVYGHAVDDQHAPGDRFKAWNMVQWPADGRPDAAAIIAALRAGRFYASRGPAFAALGTVDAGDGVVASAPGCQVDWIGPGGQILKTIADGAEPLRVADALARAGRDYLSYVRAVAFDASGLQAWSQPFFLDRVS